MTITINLPVAMERKLQAQAAATGKDVETIVREAVEVQLAVSTSSFQDILAPLHEEVASSGISEEDLAMLVDQEVAAVRSARSTTGMQP